MRITYIAQSNDGDDFSPYAHYGWTITIKSGSTVKAIHIKKEYQAFSYQFS